ncbi:MAG: Na/Pi symporter, partial [Putridiphycobacter sp.]|nr:Na/Pi symporter [Putridiphycobacter sp.]
MKKLFFSLVTVFTVMTFGFSVEENQVNDTVVSSAKTVTISGFDYEFKNDKDPLTLEILETGKLKLVWETVSSSDKVVAFKYKTLDEQEWQVISADISANEVVIEDVLENVIFEVMYGTGISANDITYDQKIHHINSLSGSIFKSNQAKGKEEGANITWGIEGDLLENIKRYYPNASFVIKYNTKIGEKQNKADATKAPWKYEKDISINKVAKKIKDLSGGESYVYKLGLVVEGKTIWADKGKFEAERTWGIFKLLVLIGSLGMFIFGMKIMSEGLQQAAGARLRNMLGSITSNRFKGVLTGFGITSIVQSSSVTTVMTVSFVNAGLMTLRQSAG